MHTEHENPADRLDCATCRAAAASTSDVDLAAVWAAIAVSVWPDRRGWFERAAGTLLRSPALARALVTTPSLVLPWLLASASVLVIGMAVSIHLQTPLVSLFAPALAGVAIAFAYGPGTDPAAEIAATLPVSGRVVLLVRSIAVFGGYAAMGILAGLVVPAATGITWLWLVPMTAVCALSLAATTLSGSAAMGTTVGLAAWSTTVLGSDLSTNAGITAAIVAHPLTPAYVVVAVVSVAIVSINPTRKGQPL
ncbi:MAG TPA: hypothetical protein VH352_01375 [Pseudonocardiaceae bacterium]|nr:hypothetical protein [Pseudonocardiaceae bacterium]